VVGNTIFKEYGNGLFATGFDIPIIWDNADIVLAQGAPAGTLAVGSYVYDERRVILLWKITIRLQREISFVCNDAS
jgi:hypothetical protein